MQRECSVSELLAEQVKTWKGQLAQKEALLAQEDPDEFIPDGSGGGYSGSVWNGAAAKLAQEIVNLKAAIPHTEKTERLLIMGRTAMPVAPCPDDLVARCISENRFDEMPVTRDQSPLVEAAARATRTGETDPALQPSMQGQKAIG